MEALDNIKKGIDTILEDWNDIVWETAKSNEDIAVDMNIEQLKSGVMPTGSDTPIYKTRSIEEKRKRGTLWGNGVNWSLHESGSWHNEMFMNRNLIGFEIDTKSPTKGLIKNPMSFMGLTDSNENEFVGILSPEILEKMNKIIFP